jgi:hypothetical protein
MPSNFISVWQLLQHSIPGKDCPYLEPNKDPRRLQDKHKITDAYLFI